MQFIYMDGLTGNKRKTYMFTISHSLETETRCFECAFDCNRSYQYIIGQHYTITNMTTIGDSKLIHNIKYELKINSNMVD